MSEMHIIDILWISGVAIEIFGYLSYQDYYNIIRTCRSLRDIFRAIVIDFVRIPDYSNVKQLALSSVSGVELIINHIYRNLGTLNPDFEYIDVAIKKIIHSGAGMNMGYNYTMFAFKQITRADSVSNTTIDLLKFRTIELIRLAAIFGRWRIMRRLLDESKILETKNAGALLNLNCENVARYYGVIADAIWNRWYLAHQMIQNRDIDELLHLHYRYNSTPRSSNSHGRSVEIP